MEQLPGDPGLPPGVTNEMIERQAGAYNDDNTIERPCERCQRTSLCEDIPMMGYSLWLCKKCAAAAYRNDEAI